MNLIQLKINAILRYTLWHLFSKRLELIQVVEFPKSGGTWMTQLVSDYLDIFYPRNVYPKFKKSVIHGHYLYSDSFNKVIFIVRDGRDIMVSYYHHLIIGNDRTNKSVTDYYRKKMSFSDYKNVEKNLPEFIEFLHKGYLKKFNRFSWTEFIDSYLKKKEDILIVKYEDMLEDTERELITAIKFVDPNITIVDYRLKQTIKKFSFKTQTKRMPGEQNENSFLRKGIAGDWKNFFNAQSAEIFDKYAGQTLIKLGYEPNSGWVDQFKKE